MAAGLKWWSQLIYALVLQGLRGSKVHHYGARTQKNYIESCTLHGGISCSVYIKSYQLHILSYICWSLDQFWCLKSTLFGWFPSPWRPSTILSPTQKSYWKKCCNFLYVRKHSHHIGFITCSLWKKTYGRQGRPSRPDKQRGSRMWFSSLRTASSPSRFRGEIADSQLPNWKNTTWKTVNQRIFDGPSIQ